nr:IS110 family transposase [uncultured Mucilaginibacter sp.]
MEFEFFIGVDVSKNTLDFAVQQGPQLLFHRKVANQPEAIATFIKEINKVNGVKPGKSLFCMEYTGIYNNHLLVYLHRKKASICLEPAAQIRNSLGTIRGKNDMVDAKRIASYAYKNRETLRLWAPKRDVVQQLAHLSSTRSRLIEAKKALSVPLKEHLAFSTKDVARQSIQACSYTIKAIDADIKKIDQTMLKAINEDEELKRLFSLATSVSGIGKVTATQIIIATNEFKDISNPKKFAAYSGVAPFKDDSGKVVKKARVSHIANKKVKTLLHLSAIVAIQHNQELKLFYERKVNQEKKNKMSVINAVRNKLILRVFACVNQNRSYEKNYQKVLA